MAFLVVCVSFVMFIKTLWGVIDISIWGPVIAPRRLVIKNWGAYPISDTNNEGSSLLREWRVSSSHPMWWWFVRLTHVSPLDKLIFIKDTQVFISGDSWHSQTMQHCHIKALSKMVLFSVTIIFTAQSVWGRGGSPRNPLVTQPLIFRNNTAPVCLSRPHSTLHPSLRCCLQWLVKIAQCEIC